MTDDVDLGIIAEHRLAHVISFFGQTRAVDLAAGARDFAGDAAAACRIGENPVRAATMVRLSEFGYELRDLVHGVLLGRELICLAFGFGVSEVRRRKSVPDSTRRFFAIVFAFDDGQAWDL